MLKKLWSQTFTSETANFVLIGLMVGLALIWVSPLAVQPSRDSGFFLYAGGQILKGRLPYIDFWDSKGPGIFFVNALGLWLGHGSRWGVWLIEFILLALSGTLFYRSGALKTGRAAALFASASWLFGLSRVMEGGNLTEEYSLFFSFILLAYFLSTGSGSWIKLSILTGVTFALSFLFRANNIGIPVSVFLSFLVLLLVNRQLRIIPWFFLLTGLTAFLLLGVISIPFLMNGTFPAMFNAAITYNFYYSGTGHGFNLNVLNGLMAIGWPAFTALAGYIVVLAQLLRRKLRSIFPIHFTALFLIGWPVEIILSSLSNKNYTHYFISWLPALALLNLALSVIYFRHIFSAEFLELLEDRWRGFLLIILGLLFGYVVSGAIAEFKDDFVRLAFERAKGTERTYPVAHYVQDNTKSDDYVLTWGAFPVINYLSRRDSPTAYLFYPAYEKSPYLDKMSGDFYREVTTKHPALIVDAYSMSPDYVLSLNPANRASQFKTNSSQLYQPPYQDQIFNFVAQNYQLVESIDGFEVYRLKSLGQ